MNFNDILIALSVVGGVALILGILLAVISKFFAVEEDQKVVAVRACLPGVNCGACGYKGCDDYAVAVAEGTAKPNLCVPGAETTAQELSEILGVEVEAPKDVIAFVHCNGTCDVAADKAVYAGLATCKAQATVYGGPKSCTYGCLGCGDCAAVCVSNAICIMDGIARVDSSRCVGCGLCAKTCPKKIISMIPQEAATVVYCSSHDKGADARKACQNACIACKKCEKACPEQAIEVINNCAVIDYSKCSGCGLCADSCPTGCIKRTVFPDLPEGFRLN